MTLVIGTLIGMVIMAILVAVGKSVKAPKQEQVEAPVTISAEQREGILSNAGKAVYFEISEDITGEMSDLTVDWIEAYGVRYNSFEEVLKSKDIEPEEASAIKETSAAIAQVRAEQMNSKRYLQVKDMLDGKVYVYEPCKMKLDVDMGAARVALELVRNKDLSMSIATILVSKMDVTAPTHRYEFDMLNVDDVEAFNLLVRESEDFKKEVEELARIESRIAHYNGLVKNNRVALENKQIVIYPPSPEEIKAMRNKGKKPVNKPLDTAEAIKAAVEEFVSSSSL